MKKLFLFLLLIGINLSAYDDFKYKHSNIGSYMFGLFGGASYSSINEDFSFEGGINTHYMYDIGERLNIGSKAAFKYSSNEFNIYDDYNFEIEPFIGFKVSPDINIYTGYGFEFLTEVETDYFLLGLDYFISEDFILEVKYKNKSFTQFENLDRNNIVQINGVIPFNFY
jgi:hypothetical protein